MPFGNSVVRNWPENRLLREPLDAAGNRGVGILRQQAQVRDLRRTRPCARGFPSVACVAALARFASAACSLAVLRTGTNFREALPLGRHGEGRVSCANV